MLPFFVLVFAFAAVFWLVGAATRLQLAPGLPVSALQFVCPGAAAAILVARAHGAAGVDALLRRSFDYRRIATKAWLIPAFLLAPGISVATFGMVRVIGLPLPSLRFSMLAALGAAVLFFVAATAEELGWSGYAIDPMQARWNALRASLLLGSIWALFHFVPLLEAHRSLGWIGWWTLGTVTFRIVCTWLYNNAGKSVFAVTLLHATSNLGSVGPFLDFGPAGFPYDAQLISGSITAAVAVFVVIFWEPRTLARFRLP
ncbi:MAG TPA: CPBP family glutamic-type intramembrane protease [Thermomicrobiales bacterium]|nr:CPBP family glutamic-type intramembrane protease [Thermomicrobiales bacterium]